MESTLINPGNIKHAKYVNSSYGIHLVRQVHPNILLITSYVNL